MALFDDRKKGEEGRFAHDEQLRFKVTARRNKLLGLWIAEMMGLKGEAADAYAKEVVASDFTRPGDSDVIEKVLADCQAHDLPIDEHKLRRHMETLMEEAARQIKAE